MRRFATLYDALDRTASTSAKRDAMAAYFADAPPEDAAWAVYVLGGGKLKRTATSTELRTALAAETGYADWLIDDSYAHVGDLAETIALMLPRREADGTDTPLHVWMEARLPSLGRLESTERVETLRDCWRDLPAAQVFLVNKLLTGSLRVGVSQRLVVQAIAQWTSLPTDLIAHRLSGTWKPSADAFRALAEPERADEHAGERPYPFFLASPLEHEVETLGPVTDWLAEWKWDGIRAQLMRRGDEAILWSRGEERLDGRFPELETAARTLPDGCVIDGEILAWSLDEVHPLLFAALQKRIGKLKPGPKLLADTPVRLMAYDLLELDGKDLRETPLHERRTRLAALLAGHGPVFMLSPAVPANAWNDLTAIRGEARERRTEGLMLKRLDSPYRVGRKRGDWWKWKVDPYTIDAVLLYAQPGHGRRSGLFTDYTFGVWDGEALVPVAKAYSGLDDDEIGRLDRWIRANTVDRFGPVRSVQPTHVFELAFEAIQASGRHKAGVAVRFPRILRWRTDLAIRDADKLDDLRRLASG
ncbi:ATP-dependent DNA ligase [Luteibacter aegosomatissinici]|uniref:ATP-dependent DNA ligase n=1 Tax=Luteibacter aegosomatissinici TaxID=2911539 RepID=UPI001FF76390|nr:ATP-dependent DNA ligase [Luteibacter aegosomatissinici]UPG96281.1 ATP-dependent DNA ligase [Luteibacter aegosomatissinici]